MSTRDKLGIVILVTLFGVLAAIMVWRANPPQGAPRSMQDSVVVQQHLKNLQQGK